MGNKKKEEDIAQQNTATVDANTGTQQQNRNTAKISNVTNQPQTNAVVMNNNGISPNAGTPVKKPKTFADYLSDGYKKAETEHTDAVKMQKYHALSDAFNAIGRMGGAAVGGAIGGDVLGSAPIVPEYKESKGYIDAFERAKKANDRIKELDNMTYQMALKEEDRKHADAKAKEQRAYDSRVREAEMNYKSREAALNREWESKMIKYRSDLQQAIADKDFERKAQLEKEMAEAEKQFKFEYQRIANEHDAAMKGISEKIVEMQTGEKADLIYFVDGSTAKMTPSQYNEVKQALLARGIIGEGHDGGVFGRKAVTTDNVDKLIRQYPDEVNKILNALKSEGNAKSEGDVDYEKWKRTN